MSVDNHGKTNWAKGLKVEVEVDGEEKAYFLKVREHFAESALPDVDPADNAPFSFSFLFFVSNPLFSLSLTESQCRVSNGCLTHHFIDHRARKSQ